MPATIMTQVSKENSKRPFLIEPDDGDTSVAAQKRRKTFSSNFQQSWSCQSHTAPLQSSPVSGPLCVSADSTISYEEYCTAAELVQFSLSKPAVAPDRKSLRIGGPPEEITFRVPTKGILPKLSVGRPLPPPPRLANLKDLNYSVVAQGHHHPNSHNRANEAKSQK